MTIRSPIHRPKVTIAALLLALAALTPLALASGGSSGGSSSETPAASPEASMSPEEKAAQEKKSAMETYEKSYEETEKAGAEMDEARTLQASGEASAKKAADKRESALKKYRKAINGFKKCVKLDPGYYEAWNMLGYTNRKLGQLGEAFKAYETCLKLNPDYDLAHEYLGEAWLQAGDVEKARAELAWLVEHKSPEAGTLETAITRVAAGETSFLGTDW